MTDNNKIAYIHSYPKTVVMKTQRQIADEFRKRRDKIIQDYLDKCKVLLGKD